MSFHQQSFHNRFGSMGDQAEAVFDAVYEGKTHALGLNRTWQNGQQLYMGKMTSAMKATPDRMVSDHLAEVMGIGRDQTGKFKDNKMTPLLEWEFVGPVTIFIYDSFNHRYWEASLGAWMNACLESGTREAFHDGPEYWALPVEHFPVEPTDAPGERDDYR